MKARSLLWILTMAGITGCSTFLSSGDADHPSGAMMNSADSLATAALLEQAAIQYALVADRYSSSSFAREALLRAAVLADHPGNPAKDDSISLARFEQYASLPLALAERQRVELETALLRRARTNDQELHRLASTVDSLVALAGQQSSLLQARAARIHELETQLTDANSELKKLRDVDVTISKRTTKK